MTTLRLPSIKYFEIRDLDRLRVCYRCGCVIVDDDEGANRGDHEAWHRAVEPLDPEEEGHTLSNIVHAKKFGFELNCACGWDSGRLARVESCEQAGEAHLVAAAVGRA